MKSNTSAPSTRKYCGRSATLALVVGLVAGVFGACGGDDPSGGPGADGGVGGDGSDFGPKPAWQGLPGARLADLPKEGPAATTHFVTAEQCRQCHQANDSNPTATRDAKGRDVSPGTTWRKSMMGLAARDPYYLAVWSQERQQYASLKTAVDAVCTRCHASAGNIETGGKLSFETLVSGTSQEAGVGRDGVNCTVCHQILPTGLGTAATFTGQFTTGDQRQVYGPHLGPDTNPMQVFVNYTPSYSDHVLKSSLCSTCHTVITPARDPSTGELLGPQFPEQTPYLEWLNSAFQDESTPPGKRAMTCIGCHVPPTDEDGKVIKTALAVSPQGLTPREPFGRHHFPGSSSGMLRLIAKGAQFVGTTVPVAELEDQAKRSEAHVSKAADLKIESAARAGDALEVKVRVVNQTGHKLPTGYPSRRMWLHVSVKNGDATVWESGAWDGWGRLVSGGKILDVAGTFQPHRDVVSAPAEVQIWEGIAGNDQGAPATHLLEATKYLKDNRLLPDGYDPTHRVAIYMRPQGVTGDPDFGSSDLVTYRITPAPPAGATVAVELVFQSVRPQELDAMAKKPTPTTLKFFDLAQESPLVPFVMTRAETKAP